MRQTHAQHSVTIIRSLVGAPLDSVEEAAAIASAGAGVEAAAQRGVRLYTILSALAQSQEVVLFFTRQAPVRDVQALLQWINTVLIPAFERVISGESDPTEMVAHCAEEYLEMCPPVP